MRLGSVDKIYIAVDSRAGVPPGIGLAGVVYFDGHYVVPLLEVGGDVIVERDVAVGAFADKAAVDIYFATVVDPFEVDIVDGKGIADGKVLAIPAQTAGEEPGAGVETRGRKFFDTPVVGEGQTAPWNLGQGKRPIPC